MTDEAEPNEEPKAPLVRPVNAGKLISLDAARKERDVHMGRGALARGADKKFVIETSAQISAGVCERMYDQIAEEHAKAFEALNEMHTQALAEAVKVLRDEAYARSWRGRWERFKAWVDELIKRDQEMQLRLLKADAPTPKV